MGKDKEGVVLTLILISFMLTHLYIKNYALIRQLDIQFHNGFSVITGETGAGKSIILGAVSILLGQRVDSKSVMDDADRCTIEATWDIDGYRLQQFFDDNDIDYDSHECIIRREFTTAGKSRAFINDTPVTLPLLKQLGSRLVDIHSQHNNLLLGNEDYQLGILDTMAGHSALLDEYRTAYREYKETEKRLAETVEESERANAEKELTEFQLEQLHTFSPKENEDELLENERNELSHAEEIKKSLYEVDNIFSNESEGGGVLEQTRRICSILQQLSSVSPASDTCLERTESALEELKDLSYEISDKAESIEYNPERLEEVNQRLDELYSLEQKHNVRSADELMEKMRCLEEKMDSINNSEEHIEKLRRELVEKERRATTLAERLTQNRTKAAAVVEKEMKKSLDLLDMPFNTFRVSMEKRALLTPDGTDNVAFLFSANRNVAPRKISDVASGGEIARVMLALKAMTSSRACLPTVIFDEIDTGVSGKVADSMAKLMAEMGSGERRQVIAITHLPQIASRGDVHYFVYKENETGRTSSHIKQLGEEERVQEIAHMLSGTTTTAAAIENAKQLLKK